MISVICIIICGCRYVYTTLPLAFLSLQKRNDGRQGTDDTNACPSSLLPVPFVYFVMEKTIRDRRANPYPETFTPKEFFLWNGEDKQMRFGVIVSYMECTLIVSFS